MAEMTLLAIRGEEWRQQLMPPPFCWAKFQAITLRVILGEASMQAMAPPS